MYVTIENIGFENQGVQCTVSWEITIKQDQLTLTSKLI